MKVKKKHIKSMIADLEDIRKTAIGYEEEYAPYLEKVHPGFQESATNLVHYLALRHQDVRELQFKLGNLGISRLGRAESHVMASLLAVRHLLHTLIGKKDKLESEAVVSFKQGGKIIKRNTTALLGKKQKRHSKRIMVTMPSKAAENYALVKQLLQAGMTCARINCAKDGPGAWLQMIAYLKQAKEELGQSCRICMDLGGPKLRTGEMRPGPQVVHLRPLRDQLGRTLKPAYGWLAPPENPPHVETDVHIPVAEAWMKQLEQGDTLLLVDGRGKKCTFNVLYAQAEGCRISTYDSAYVTTGTELQLKRDEEELPGTSVGQLPHLEETLMLRPGDTLLFHRDPRPGEPAKFDAEGNLLAPAHISCTLPEVFADLKVGEPVLMDDGKIEGKVIGVSDEELEIEITFAKASGAKLKADKGVNFPESQLHIRGLTEKDKEDLAFVVEHADVVNVSFVNNPQDVEDLLTALRRLNAREIGIILKIETRSGYRNLPGILLTAMQNYPLGVMIARGDLAIEGGWQHLARIQEEIMWLCEAAHIPIVWATQVLETLAKKGRPSRAEITDAATAQGAECVMLNKGPHILKAIEMLDYILKSMSDYHQKKAPMLPGLRMSSPEPLQQKGEKVD
jgi:pyruvate kinase